jgi:hypothetical protein
MRNKIGIVIQIFCPILWCACLYYFDSREPIMEAMRSTFGDRHEYVQIPKCYGEGCTTIGYSIIGDPAMEEEYSWIDTIMRSVADTNDLKVGEDVNKLTVGTA